MEVKKIRDFSTMMRYFSENLDWNINVDDFEKSDYTYDIYPEDINVKDEEFSKIEALYQLRPFKDKMPFGIFGIEFESKKLERVTLRKILSGLINKGRHNNPNMPSWNNDDILFLCFWGERNKKYVGVACFDENNKNLPILKIHYCESGLDDKEFGDHLDKLKMPKDTSDTDTWRKQWRSAFTATYRSQITNSKELAEKLADHANHTKKRIINAYNVETSIGYVHLLYEQFKEKLVHDMTIEQFADMYAQTIAYGLFTAKCMDNSPKFDWDEAINNIPNTNPFLKTLISGCLDPDNETTGFFDELAVNEIIEILNHTDINNIMENFNRRSSGGSEDTVIYFYEDFLSYYEHETKKRRGVYYTPWPVVSFMVRAVNDILKTEFGFEDGLAQNKERKKSKAELGTQYEAAVNILDPATGTGTFLREVILNIHENFENINASKSSEERKKLWNQYIPKYLLPRLNGFELMMAPYAVAHMKLAMILKETGYEFESTDRLKVVLTNSLEPPNSNLSMYGNYVQGSLYTEDPLAAESSEADIIKNDNSINVILGNPPYSGESANKGKWIMNLMDDYKKEPGGKNKLQERNPKNINADENKFIRLAQYYIEKSKNGIVAFITPHSYTDNLTFRGMRWKLYDFFDKIYILDLHGNVMSKEQFDTVDKDENVFDIQQGVAISIFIKNKSKAEKTKVFYSELYGLRNYKYQTLNQLSIKNTTWTEVFPDEPNFFFKPKNLSESDSYNTGFSIAELFPVHNNGVKTHHDNELISTTAFNTEFNQLYDYRPFDTRYINYDLSKVERARYDTMKHLKSHDNIGLIINRQVVTDNWSHIQIVNNMIDARFHYSRKGSPVECPLYIYHDKTVNNSTRSPNFNMDIIRLIEKNLRIPFSILKNDSDSFNPVDLLDYIYAVLYSKKYRDKYKEFLKINFPRVPYPTNKEQFWKLVNIGGKLRECHLLKTSLDITPYTFNGDGTNEVVKPEYKHNRVYISKTLYFDNVPKEQWEQNIGGYQPLQKWLKDRKKTCLSVDDIEHYKKIIAALKFTEKLMSEIDENIEF